MRSRRTILSIWTVLSKVNEDVVTSSWSKKKTAPLSQVELNGFGAGVFGDGVVERVTRLGTDLFVAER